MARNKRHRKHKTQAEKALDKSRQSRRRIFQKRKVALMGKAREIAEKTDCYVGIVLIDNFERCETFASSNDPNFPACFADIKRMYPQGCHEYLAKENIFGHDNLDLHGYPSNTRLSCGPAYATSGIANGSTLPTVLGEPLGFDTRLNLLGLGLNTTAIGLDVDFGRGSATTEYSEPDATPWVLGSGHNTEAGLDRKMPCGPVQALAVTAVPRMADWYQSYFGENFMDSVYNLLAPQTGWVGQQNPRTSDEVVGGYSQLAEDVY